MINNVICIEKYMNDSYINFMKYIFGKNIKFIDAPSLYKKNSTEINQIKYRESLLGKNSVMLFTGGPDVDPDIYEEPKHPKTVTDPSRDLEEITMFNLLLHDCDLKIGICRGAQLLTVLNGGKLLQHVEGHTNSHNINAKLNQQENSLMNSVKVPVTSTHHQMMFPFNLEENQYEILAYSTIFLSGSYENGFGVIKKLPKYFVEPEIVFYNHTRSLAIQGHPEFSNASVSFKNLISKYCNDFIKLNKTSNAIYEPV